MKILAQCRKAIPSREDGGKVTIGDIVIDYSPRPLLETHLLMDIVFMTMTKDGNGTKMNGVRFSRTQG